MAGIRAVSHTESPGGATRVVVSWREGTSGALETYSRFSLGTIKVVRTLNSELKRERCGSDKRVLRKGRWRVETTKGAQKRNRRPSVSLEINGGVVAKTMRMR